MTSNVKQAQRSENLTAHCGLNGMRGAKMPNKDKWVLSRIGPDGRPGYVSHTPGDGGVDWGYTFDADKAKPLSEYWKRRFLADMKRVNARGARAVLAPSKGSKHV